VLLQLIATALSSFDKEAHMSRWRPLACVGLLALSGLTTLTADEPDRLVPTARSFVPLEDLDAVIERDRQGVLLPKAEFEKLLAAATENARKHPPAPLPAVLDRVDYRAEIVGDQLVLTATARLEQLRPDWHVWSLPLPRLALEQATLDGQPAAIARGEDGVLQVFTSTVGRHELVLELSTELVTLGSDQAAGVALLPAAAAELTLSVPAGKRLLVDGSDLPRPKPLAEPADYRVAVGGRKQLQLRLTDRVDQQRTDALVFASTGYGLIVAPGEVTWHALTTLQVFGRPVNRVVLTVPQALEIADVESTGLESWELSDVETGTQLTLTFSQPIDGSRRIAVRGVMSVPAGEPWSVPPLRIADVTSHVGQIIVQHPAAVRLQTLETDGVRRATAGAKPVSDMPETMGPVAAASTLRFDAWREDFTLRLAAEPKQRELHVAVAGVLDLGSSQAELQVAFTVATRFAPLFELDVDAPADWAVVAATTESGQPLLWQVLPHEPGTSRVRVTLPGPLAPGASTVVNLQWRYAGDGWPVEQAAVELTLPELIVPQAALVETALVIRGDNDLELTASDVTGLDAVPLKAEWERLRFQSQDTRYAAKLTVVRKPARIAVETVAFYRLDPQTLHVWLQAGVQVEGGGLRSLEVSLPESVGDAVRFSVAGATLVEQQPLEPADGRRRWRLVFGARVFGRFGLWTELERPRGDATEFAVPVLEIADAARQHGAFVVEAGPEQQLTITAADGQGLALREIDPVDLPPTPYTRKERIVAAYRTLGAGNSLTLTEQRFAKSAVPTAVCPHLQVLTVASRTGELQQQAEFALRLAGVQQLQVVLPEKAELWAALLNAQPVEIRRTDGRLLIPLPLDAAGEQQVTLTLFYRQTTDALMGAGRLQQSPPELAVLSGSGTTQSVEILEQSWRLVHPGDTLVVDSRTPLEPQSPLDVPGWLTSWAAVWQMPRTPDLLWGALAVAITAGAWALVVLIWRRFHLYGMATALVVLSLIVPLGICLMMPGVQSARRAARVPVARDYASDYAVGMPAAASMPAGMESTPPTSGPAVSFDFDNTRAEGLQQRSRMLGEDKSGTETERIKGIAAGIAVETNTLDALSLQIRQQQVDPFAPAVDAPAPAPQAAEPQAAPAGQPVSQRAAIVSLAAKDSGLLSLSLKLETPPDAREKTFRYVGSDAVGQGLSLDVDYVDRRGGLARRLALFAFGAVVAWGLRRRPVSLRIALVVLGLAISLGLMPLAAVAWQPWLDGVFCAVVGALAAWLLWGCGRAIECCCRWCCPRAVAALIVAVGLSGLGSGDLLAQEPAARAPAPPPPAPIPPSIVEVYGTDPLTANQVLLPHAKFVELYRLAHPERPVLSPAPTPGGLVTALYSGELVPAESGADAAVKFRAQFALRSDVDGQLAVELPLGSVTIHSAVLNDTAAALVTAADRWQVLLPKPGLYVLDVEFSVPATITGAAGSFVLPLKPTPAAKLSFRLPADKLAVRVNGSTSVYRRVTVDGQTHVELPVDRGGELRLSWQPDQARGGAAVVHVESVTAVTATDAGAAVSAGFRLRVRQGVVRDLAFELPAAVKLRGVSGPDVGGWELVGDEAARRLRVFLRRNVGDQTELTIDGFLTSQIEQDTAVVVPNIVPLEVTAEVGQVAVYAGPQFSVRAVQTDSLMQIDAATFTPGVPVSRLEQPPQLAYRFNRRPWTLDLRIGRLATQLRATVQQGVRVSHRKTQTTVRVVCDLSLVPRSSLELDLPVDWLVLDVQSPGLRDWFRTPSDNRAILTLEYDQPREGNLEVVVLASEPRSESNAAVTLSAPEVIGASRQQRQLGVWFDDGLSGRIASLGGWRTIDAASVAAELRQLRGTPAQLALESSAETPGQVELAVDQLQPRLSGSSLAAVTVTDVGVMYGLVLQWQIDRAATETLVVEGPEWLAGRLQFDRDQIRDVTEQPAADGTTTQWTLRLRGPVSGRFIATASAALPPVTDRVLAPGVRFLSAAAAAPLATQTHYVLLSNASLSQLTSEDPALTEPVQREDIDLVVRPELVQQATEFVRVKTAGRAPSWSMQRYVPAAAIPAAVNLVDLTTVLARDGSYRTQATFTLKNRSRQFLAVRLPTDTRVLAVQVSGQPSRAVETQLPGGPALLIALPRTSAVDLSFPVQVVYAGRLSHVLPPRHDWRRQELDLPTIEVVSQTESQEFGIPVARTQWTVYLPDDLQAAPLTDAARHNLNRAREVETQESAVQVLLSDADSLFGALSEVGSVRGKMRAYSNLKQLDLTLQNYSEVTAGNAEFREKAAAVKENLVQLQRSLERGEASGTVVLSDGAVQSLDAVQQWGQALSNNGFLFIDNRNSDLQQEGQIDTTFNFTVPASPQAAGKPGGEVKAFSKQVADGMSESGIVGNSIEARQQYQMRNDEQLSRLNTAISGKKQDNLSSFSRQGGGQDGNVRFGTNAPQAGGFGGVGGGGLPGSSGGSDRASRARDTNGRGVERWFDSDSDGLTDLTAMDGVFILRGNQADMDQVMMAMGQMGGGGIGGGGFGDDGVDGELAAARGWTQAGGLSLLIDIPTAGQKLVFSKAGGDAKLALAVRPQESLSLGLGAVWGLVWLVVAALLLRALQSAEHREWLLERLPVALCVLAGLAVLATTGLVQTAAWLAFAVMAGWLAWRNCVVEARG
jgi:hypothetical protein